MRALDGMRILGPADGLIDAGPDTQRRTLIEASDTGGRWALGEVVAEPDDGVATHVHPGEPEAIVILEGDVELHGNEGVVRLGAGDVVFIPPTQNTASGHPKAGGGSRSGPPARMPACPARGTVQDPDPDLPPIVDACCSLLCRSGCDRHS